MYERRKAEIISLFILDFPSISTKYSICSLIKKLVNIIPHFMLQCRLQHGSVCIINVCTIIYNIHIFHITEVEFCLFLLKFNSFISLICIFTSYMLYPTYCIGSCDEIIIYKYSILHYIVKSLILVTNFPRSFLKSRSTANIINNELLAIPIHQKSEVYLLSSIKLLLVSLLTFQLICSSI